MIQWIWQQRLIIALLVCIMAPLPAVAEGISNAQGEQILKEIRALRSLLESSIIAPSNAPPPARVAIAEHPSMGHLDAPLTLVEFSDYQCPFCKRFHDETLVALKRDFIDTGKLRLVYYDLPLPFHQWAREAAHVARCAGDQGKYWTMHDLLMADIQKLAPEHTQAHAQSMGLDMAQYDGCMASGKYADSISNDVEIAGALGISGTPSFVLGPVVGGMVDGEKIVGAQPYAIFADRINTLLATH
jgi:protein-disulfide isomerase